MTKIWIKPLRNLWFMNMVLHDGEVIELPEEQAQVLLKNGWAQFAQAPEEPKSEKEPKERKKPKDNNKNQSVAQAETPVSPPETPAAQAENEQPETTQQENGEQAQNDDEQPENEQPENDENQEIQANGAPVQGDLTAVNDDA